MTALQSTWSQQGNISRANDAAYTLRAVEHHCCRLAEEYARACDFAAESEREARAWTLQDKFAMGGLEEPYVEFEALVTAVRRAYEMQKLLLWGHLGAKHSAPKSYYKAIPLCAGLPSTDRQRLQQLWDDSGALARSYRDCAQHYTPATTMFQYASAATHASGAMTVSYIVPDNPGAQSARTFTFARKLDALTLAWDFAECLLLSAETIAAALGGTTPAQE